MSCKYPKEKYVFPEGNLEVKALPPNYLSLGYVNPHEIVLPSLADSIEEGDERLCFITVLYSTNEVYLAFSSDFPGKINDFICEAGKLYIKNSYQCRRTSMIASPDDLKPGAIVCVYHEEDKEWKRAKIMEHMIEDEDEDLFRHCKVQLLDLGEYHYVHRINIVYLHQDLINVPTYAIKAKLHLSEYYDRDLKRKSYSWNKTICGDLLRCIFQKKIHVKFIRQVEQNGEKIWEVSLLRFKGSKCPSRPIEQEIIKFNEGMYIQFLSESDDDSQSD